MVMKKSKPLIRGTIDLKIRGVEDYYSLMHLLRRDIKKKWKISDAEFWDCVQMYVELECPKRYLYPS